MPYTINKSDGTQQTIITDGAKDNSTSLDLLGKNYLGYGDEIATNFLHLLENFSYNIAPSNPVKGQLWYKSDVKSLQVYTGTIWQQIANLTVSTSNPGAKSSGDLWWDSINSQLYGYTGSEWALIGPPTSSLYGKTGWYIVEIADSGVVPQGQHIVIKEYINNTLIAVHSKDSVAFTPDFTGDSADMIYGFSTINPGMNFATNIGNIQLTGTASNATTLNNLSSTDFLRANVPALTTSSLTVQSDLGFILGAGQDLLLDITNGQDIRFKNQTANGNIALSVSGTGQILAPTGYTTTDTYSLTTKAYVDAAILTANTSVAASTLFRDGTNTIIGNIAPNANVYTFGSTSARFSNIYSTTFTGNLSGSVSGTTATLTGNVSANNVVTTNNISGTSLTISGNSSVQHITVPVNNAYDLGGTNYFRNANATTFNGTTVNATTINGTTINGTTFAGTNATISALTVTGNVRLNGSTSGFVGIKAAAVAGSTTFTLPNADGTAGQVLTTDGGGTLSWTTIPTATSNGYGTRTISTFAPSGGNDGDIWYQVAS